MEKSQNVGTKSAFKPKNFTGLCIEPNQLENPIFFLRRLYRPKSIKKKTQISSWEWCQTDYTEHQT